MTLGQSLSLRPCALLEARSKAGRQDHVISLAESSEYMYPKRDTVGPHRLLQPPSREEPRPVPVFKDTE